MLLYILIGIAIVIVLYIFSSSIVIVAQQEVRIIERLGKFNKVLMAGFHLKIPLMDRVVARNLNLRIQQLDVEIETKTKDNVFVKIKVSTQFQVLQEKIFDAFYRLADVSSQMQSYIFDVVRSKVPRMGLDEVFENKDTIALNVQKELGTTMEAFGFKIIKSLITDLDPDPKVKSAMNEINEKERLKLAVIQQAEASKIRKIKLAEADAEAMRLTGIGISSQRKAIVDGLKNSIEDFSKAVNGVTAKDIMNLVLKVQYYDTLKDVTNNSSSNTILLPSNPNDTFEAKLQELLLSTQLATQKNNKTKRHSLEEEEEEEETHSYE